MSESFLSCFAIPWASDTELECGVQSALIRRAEDTESDAAELSATKLRVQQQTSSAVVVADRGPTNGISHQLPISRPTPATPAVVSCSHYSNCSCLSFVEMIALAGKIAVSCLKSASRTSNVKSSRQMLMPHAS